ncbi:MAG: hypothetical protein AAB896_00590 [Patescibacteria group bacterium]
MADLSKELGVVDSAELMRERIDNKSSEGLICAIGSVATAGIAISNGFEHGGSDYRVYLFSAMSSVGAALSVKSFRDWRSLKKLKD